MANNHHKPTTQQERSFWRDVFVAVIPKHHNVRRAADTADTALAEYRKRITWRGR